MNIYVLKLFIINTIFNKKEYTFIPIFKYINYCNKLGKISENLYDNSKMSLFMVGFFVLFMLILFFIVNTIEVRKYYRK